jgi:hypothetical protein
MELIRGSFIDILIILWIIIYNSAYFNYSFIISGYPLYFCFKYFDFYLYIRNYCLCLRGYHLKLWVIPKKWQHEQY